MKIYLGSDHAGFALKGEIRSFLDEKGFEVVDLGPASFDEGDDYPDFVLPVAKAVCDEVGALGVVIGYSGQGEAMCANRVSGVRAALYYGGDRKILTLSREHNDANVLSLGAGFLSTEEALTALELWLEASFTGEERHLRRINKF